MNLERSEGKEKKEGGDYNDQTNKTHKDILLKNLDAETFCFNFSKERIICKIAVFLSAIHANNIYHKTVKAFLLSSCIVGQMNIHCVDIKIQEL